MKNIPIPSREEDFTADPAELFFDLSFVFAFSRLVFHLVHDPTLEGFGEFLLLFALIWFAWSNFTWSANAVAGNSRFVRAVFMVATAISLPMAASLEAPFGDGSVVFAVAVSVILVLPIVTGSVLLDDALARSSIIRYLGFNFGAIALVLGGGFTEDGLQLGLWIAAVAVLIVGTIDGGNNDWLVRPGHFAERHGLIIIVALGEVLVAIGAPVVELLSEGKGLDARLVAALTASGTLAALLWWFYFDRALPAMEHRHGEMVDGHDSSRFARDVYTWGHSVIVAGVLVAAAALEEIMLHPADPLPSAFRWMLFIGLAGFLLGVVVSILRAYSVLALERMLAVTALAVLIAASGSLDGLWLLIAVDVLLLVVLAVEHYRVEVVNRMLPVSRKSPVAHTSADS